MVLSELADSIRKCAPDANTSNEPEDETVNNQTAQGIICLMGRVASEAKLGVIHGLNNLGPSPQADPISHTAKCLVY